jgi:Holliday junction resolvase RusA-like endonuclease
MGVDPTKPMRITFRFCVKDKRFDTDNLVKSALDRVAAYYELGTDNNFVSVDSSKYLDTVDCFEHGEIRFAIRNLTHNEINSLLFDPIANDNTLTVY